MWARTNAQAAERQVKPRTHFGRSQISKATNLIKTLLHFALGFEYDDEASAERFALAACCHANQLMKRDNVFRAEKSP